MVYNALLALVPTVIGGFIALAGVFLSTRNSRALAELQLQNTRVAEQRKIYREAGSEVYSLFSSWGTLIFVMHLPLFSVMHQKISYNDYLDQQIEAGKNNRVDHHRMEFLISCYFPELNKMYKGVRESLRKHNDVVYQHKISHERGENGKRFISILSEAQEELERKIEDFKQALLKEVQKYI